MAAMTHELVAGGPPVGPGGIFSLRAARSSTCWTSSPRAASGAGTRHRAFRRSLTGRSALPLRRS